MQITRRQALILIAGVLVFLGLLVAMDQFIERLSPWDYDDVERWMADLGAWGPIAYIAFFSVSMVFALIPTSPAPIAAAAVFGAALGFLYTLLGGTIGAVASFYIARRWGRPLMERLMPVKTVVQIDRLADQLGIRILILLRLFPLIGADYVSYAAGLTRIRIGVYIIISVLGSVPTLLLVSIVGENVTENRTVAAVALAVLAVFLLTPLTYFALWKQPRPAARPGDPALSGSIPTATDAAAESGGRSGDAGQGHAS